MAVSSRPIGCSAPENCTNASLTWTCATDTASGPSLRTVKAISPGDNTVRSTASSSAGGPRRSPSPGASKTMNSTTPAQHQQERNHAEDPRRGPHLTSKNPCHPSSVNSLWWAWNMYLPGYGKRHSRIPRWPWQSITVSVSSDGREPVPVG